MGLAYPAWLRIATDSVKSNSFEVISSINLESRNGVSGGKLND